MRYFLLAVGRARQGPEQDLFELYRKRLTHSLTVREVEERRAMPLAQRVRREGVLLLAEVPAGAAIVVLDEQGAAMDSEELSAFLDERRERGGDVAFLIGGADGHAPEVGERADLLLSMGRLTWPHMLVRALLAEQLYRCECIRANHPYHRKKIFLEKST